MDVISRETKTQPRSKSFSYSPNTNLQHAGFFEVFNQNEKADVKLSLPSPQSDIITYTHSSSNSIHFSSLNIVPQVVHVNSVHSPNDSPKSSFFFSKLKARFTNLVKSDSNTSSILNAKQVEELEPIPMEELKKKIAREECALMDDVSYAVYIWLIHVTNEAPLTCDSFINVIRSGKLLFKLSKIAMLRQPSCCVSFTGASYTIHQILWFLLCCKTLGLQEKHIFSLLSLTSSSSDPRPIILTLQLFDAICRKKGWNGHPFPEVPSSYFEGKYVPPAQKCSPNSQILLGKEKIQGSDLMLKSINRFQQTMRKTLTLQRLEFDPSKLRELQEDSTSDSSIEISKKIPSETLDNFQAKFVEIIEKFLLSEKRFCEDLNVCCKWQKIIKDCKKISSEEEMAIFRNLSELFTYHNSMYQLMLEANEVETISFILLEHFESLKKSYTEFNHQQQTADDVFKKASKTPELKQMLDEFLEWPPAQAISLEFYFLLITDHLLAYYTFLNNLILASSVEIKSVLKAHALYKTLTSDFSWTSISTSSDIEKEISHLSPDIDDKVDIENSSVGLHKNVSKIMSLRTLKTGSRSFICRGAVWQVLKNNKVKPCHILLFKDLLVIAKLIEDDYFEIRTILSLKSFELLPSTFSLKKLGCNQVFSLDRIGKFNEIPENGILDLIEKESLQPHSTAIANFLQTVPHLSRFQVAKYLCDPINNFILSEYISWFGYPLTLMNFVHSFRLLLSTINFKDQDQSIDYLKNAYCSVYCQKNPGYLFSEAELRLLIDDILDINAAVHNGNSHLISKSEFLQKHQTAPESLLHELWDSVCNEELKMASHGTNFLDLSHMPENITLNETISFELSTPSDLKNIKVKVQAPPGISFNPTELNFGNESVCKVELKGLTLGTWKIHFFPLENSHNLLEYINPKIISVEPSFITNTFTLKYTQKSEDEEPHSFFTFAISKTSQLHTFRKHIEEAIIKYKKRN